MLANKPQNEVAALKSDVRYAGMRAERLKQGDTGEIVRTAQQGAAGAKALDGLDTGLDDEDLPKGGGDGGSGSA